MMTEDNSPTQADPPETRRITGPILDELHHIFTAHGIVSRAHEYDGMVTELVQWAVAACRTHQAAEITRLTQERDNWKWLANQSKHDHEHACITIAMMHAAAIGEATRPKRGVIEDVEDVRKRAEKAEAERDQAWLTGWDACDQGVPRG